MNSLNNFVFSTHPRTHGKKKKTVKKKVVEYHQSPGKVWRVVGEDRRKEGEGHALLTSSSLLHSVYMCTHLHTCMHTHAHTHTL